MEKQCTSACKITVQRLIQETVMTVEYIYYSLHLFLILNLTKELISVIIKFLM